MIKENRITINNLIYSLLFLVFGIILLTSTEDLVSIASKIIGAVLIIVGIVKSIIYVYMKGKVGDYGVTNLLIGILLICFGVSFVFFSSALSFVIRTVIGAWVLLAGINRIIFAISTISIDKKGFMVYLITSFIMFALGFLLISGIFDQVVGLLIILYSITELIDYIYYKVKYKEYQQPEGKLEIVKKDKKNSKKGKVVDAKIDED